MNENFWKEFLPKLIEKYEKENIGQEIYADEIPILHRIFEIITLSEGFKDVFEFDEPIGIGGAGVVVRVKDKRLNWYRALKIPRPKEDNLISVKSEMAHLRDIRHENIIGLHALGEVENQDFKLPYPYFIMDYIKDAQDLRKKASMALDGAKNTKDFAEVMGWLAATFFKIAKAVCYLHLQEIIHFDIKPTNILITADDRPVLSDLGFAKKKSKDEKATEVGFTLFYAHPDLSHDYRHQSTKNKVKKAIAPNNFKYAWDLYAFGRSLLEIITLADQRFPDIVAYDYSFVYLHLSACRMLDGRNLYLKETDRIRQTQIQNGETISIYREIWQEIDAPDFEQIKYLSFENVCLDFEKLLYGEKFLNGVPELKISYPKRVQTSEGTPAPFTKRVKFIIEHPIVSRLSYVSQLGPINTVYPTATHTRLEHSLGTFRNCCLYVQALFNDPYNPVFKQLVTEEDLKAVLLASLLHDLGQYPLGHELEGISQHLRHENLTLKFLETTFQDKNKHSLKDILENHEWGWGVKVERIKEILSSEDNGQMDLFSKSPLKIQMLSAIINGPIDVDKLDYLIRDSQNCYLKYGELIDLDRLIRTLTVVILNLDSSEKALTIGTYEKGQSAAESLTFARYLLYQSVYWHHTSRAVRAMLRKTFSPISKGNKGSKKTKKTFYDAFNDLIGLTKKPQNINVVSMLSLIREWTDDGGKELIDMIELRDFYKRILTIQSYPAPEKGNKSFIERFRVSCHGDPKFEEKLQDRIKQAFSDFLARTQSPKISLLSPVNTDDTMEMFSRPNMILCDCPEPISGGSGKEKDNLRFIPEPERLQKNYFVRGEAGKRVSQVWNEVHFKLMDIASKGRVFCHPKIRDTLMAALGPQGIKDCLEREIKQSGH